MSQRKLSLKITILISLLYKYVSVLSMNDSQWVLESLCDFSKKLFEELSYHVIIPKL